MLTPQPTEQINASSSYNFLYGRFALGKFAIPYLVVSMRLSDAASELQIAEEAGMTFEDAQLEELYQRQVDWDRVLHRIAPYLRDGNRPQFFNALTVALLPKRASGSFAAFDEEGLVAPKLHGDYGDEITVGPVRLGIYGAFDPENPSTLQVGQVRWNRDQVYCLAIDGQHRLGAIKQLQHENNSGLTKSHITVILVIPSPVIGLSEEAQRRGHVRLMRDLFTDLNKHAELVSRTRSLLLDDYDPQSLCVRRMVGTCLMKPPPNWRDTDPSRIPLTLVDWHTDESKFGEGPYLSSLLVIDQVIGAIMGVKPVRDWTDAHEVRKRQITPLTKLGWTPTEECSARLKQLDETEGSIPFSYPDDDLSAIVDAFARTWSPALTYLLTQIQHYADLIEARRRDDMLSPDFVMWFDAYHVHSKQPNSKTFTRLQGVIDRLKYRNPPVLADRKWRPWVEKTGRETKSRFRKHKDQTLFYRVVFQKALFFALDFLNGYGHPEYDLDEVTNSTDLSAFCALSDAGINAYRWSMNLVDVVNHLAANDKSTSFFSLTHRTDDAPNDAFWLGTVAKADDPETIDFTNAAAKRARNWLVLATLLWRCRDGDAPPTLPDSLEGTTLDAVLAGLTEKYPQDWRSAFIVTAENLYGNKQGRAMRYVVKAANPDVEDPSDEFTGLLDDAFFRRLRHLVMRIEAACIAG